MSSISSPLPLLSSFNWPSISPFFLAWGCDWLLVPVPGTPNGSCNYHSSTTVLSVHSPAKQEGSFGSPDQTLRPLIMKQKEKPKHGAKSMWNVPRRAVENGNDSRPEDILGSSAARTRWCQKHRCWACVWSDRCKRRAPGGSRAMMVLRNCLARTESELMETSAAWKRYQVQCSTSVKTSVDRMHSAQPLRNSVVQKVTLDSAKLVCSLATKKVIIEAHFEGLSQNL